MLTELSTRSLAERTQRIVVLAVIVSLHALLVYFLANGAPDTYGHSDTPVIDRKSVV